MRTLTGLSSLLRGLAFCGVGAFCVGAAQSQDELLKSDTPSCSVPAGLYNIQQLGAGHDSLHLSVSTSGDVRGSYRLSAGADAYEYPPLYEVWFDSSTSRIKCHGDTVEIGAGHYGHSIYLALVWNRALVKLEVTGSYTGNPGWPRWLVTSGLKLATIGALIYSSGYVYHHQRDFQVLYGGFKIARTSEAVFGSGTPLNTLFRGLGYQVQGAGYKVWGRALKYYLINMHTYDFTLPAAGMVAGMLTTPFISGQTTYPLRGRGGQFIAGQKEKTCTVPMGNYRGQLFDPLQGSLTITVPVGLNSDEVSPKVLVSSMNNITAYNITPSTIVCQGNEVVLEWSSSLPPSTGRLSAFYDKEKGLIGSGVFTSTGWVRNGQPILMPSLQLVKENLEGSSRLTTSY